MLHQTRTNMKLQEIMLKAEVNAIGRLALIKDIQWHVSNNQPLRDRIYQVDPTFVRKILRFPGDITSHRIATVLRKIGE